MLARDVMIDDVAFVTLDVDVSEVARRLAETPTGAVVVVDVSRRPIGMVTRSDIERASAGTEKPPIPRWLIKREAPIQAFNRNLLPLSDVMTAPAIYVPDIAQLLDLVPLMENKRLKRLPVVSSGALVGVLRRADVWRAMSSAPTVASNRGVESLTAQSFRELATRHEAIEQQQREQAKRLALEEQQKLIEAMAQRRLSERDWAEMIAGARRAAIAGLKEYTLLRFPSRLCWDGGRAINAPDPHWPDLLRGEARDVYERWRTELEPAGFGLAAQIISFPDGIPGDAALVLIWGA